MAAPTSQSNLMWHQISPHLLNFSRPKRLVDYIPPSFHAADYVVYTAFHCIFIAIGIFFFFTNHRTVQDFHYGSRKMSPIPLGISTGMSFFSATSLLGYPAEIYFNGCSYILGSVCGCVGYFCGCCLVAYFLHPLKATSLSDFFQARFHSRVATLFSSSFLLLTIFLYLGICMLGAVMTFQSVTDGWVKVSISLAISATVGIFYTIAGGFRAVVWSSVVQFCLVLIGIVTVTVSTVLETSGGVSRIVKQAYRFHRILPLDWSVDFTIRHSAWGLIFGMFFSWAVWSCQPVCVHRLCSAKSRKQSVVVSLIACSVFFLCSIVSEFVGMNIFGYFTSRGCDVYAAGWISKNDIVLYYIRERLNSPGFQGLFLAALFSASLSSLSSGLSTASAIVWQDAIQPFVSTDFSQRWAIAISRIIVAVFGILAMSWSYLLYFLGGLLNLITSTVDASLFGAYVGAFVLSILLLHVSGKAVVCAFLASFAFTLWLGLGMIFNGRASPMILPSTVETCSFVVNVSRTSPTYNSTTPGPSNILYSVSHLWVPIMTLLVAFATGIIINGLCGSRPVEDENLGVDFNSPFRSLFQRRGMVVISSASRRTDVDFEMKDQTDSLI